MLLDQRAPEIAAARTADPRDFVDDRILRELRSQRFLARALGEPWQPTSTKLSVPVRS